jgi:hypothetical protein
VSVCSEVLVFRLVTGSLDNEYVSE